jgi:uncharacterized protein (DUF427 family)
MKKAIWNGYTIAESDNTQELDGVVYFPEEVVKREFLKASSSTSSDATKGQAKFYSLCIDGAGSVDAAWYYPDPKPAARFLKHHIAFWRDVEITD